MYLCMNGNINKKNTSDETYNSMHIHDIQFHKKYIFCPFKQKINIRDEVYQPKLYFEWAQNGHSFILHPEELPRHFNFLLHLAGLNALFNISFYNS